MNDFPGQYALDSKRLWIQRFQIAKYAAGLCILPSACSAARSGLMGPREAPGLFDWVSSSLPIGKLRSAWVLPRRCPVLGEEWT